MRIRKRPLSLFSPATFFASDPTLVHHQTQSLSAVQLESDRTTEAIHYRRGQAFDPYYSSSGGLLHLHGPTTAPDLRVGMMIDGNSAPQRPSQPPIMLTEPHTPPLISVGEVEEAPIVISPGKEENEKKVRSSIEESQELEAVNPNRNSQRHLSLSCSSSGAITDDCTRLPPSPTQDEKGAAVSVTLTPPAGRWVEGDKNMPLKKRRARFEMINGLELGTKMNTTMMMSKTNKISNSISPKMISEDEVKNNNDEASEEAVDKEQVTESYNVMADGEGDHTINLSSKTTTKRFRLGNSSGSIGKKKKNIDVKKRVKSKAKISRGARILMQGSRCSRVNGRGWRCSQPTLVGYSLCEHHLGKGRHIKSISSTFNHLSSFATSSPTFEGYNHHQLPTSSITTPSTIIPLSDSEEDHHFMSSKHGSQRAKKVGVVKARSLSSLLGQLNAMVPPAAAALPINGRCK